MRCPWSSTPRGVRLVRVLRRQPVPVDETGKQMVMRMLRAYPRYSDGLAIDSISLDNGPLPSAAVQVVWRSPDGTLRDPRSVAQRYLGHYWLFPEAGGVTMTPFFLWWSLLYGLSDLARYHPAEWTEVLDVIDSWQAVSIEKALSDALAIVPRLVLEVLLPGEVTPDLP